MKFYSTKNKSHKVDLKTAVLKSLPPDNGLYMPERIPTLPKKFIDDLKDLSFQEIAFQVCWFFLQGLSDEDIWEIVNQSITFPAPLVQLDSLLYSLELWHGPSLAFKDFGARFMAALMSKLVEGENKTRDILVATSGDTGGAVAAGFYEVSNIRVTILYPSGKVSFLQEKQLTTLGKNISALEIEGTFDDCQRLVKKAFLDKELNKKLNLSSANSINIARLIPQSFYYFEAFKQLPENKLRNVGFCVPSGNFGNLTAGLMARKMGLPFKKVIAATNINNVVPLFLRSGHYNPMTAITTISNAMDVGNPSNFQRMLDLYGKDHKKMETDIHAYFFSDDQTRICMKELLEKYNYTADPHGAVGFLACREYSEEYKDATLINLETAHPSKFLAIMKNVKIAIDIPERLEVLRSKEKRALQMTPSFSSFKDYLLNR